MTPGCSVCGYAVEVVRSCFRSRWRLFRGRPETTAGQYVFAGEDAEVYPGWHNFWSRDWISNELDGAQLGEDPTAKRSYALGAPLGAVAGPELLGDADCIANGERWPLAVVPTLVGGFDARCPELLSAPRLSLDVRDVGDWCFWAQVIVRSYTDAAGARAQVAARLGVPDGGWAFPTPQGIMPAYWGLLPPPGAPIVVLLAGTDNTVQWVAQVAYGIGPPRTQGTFGTNPVWYTDSSIVLDTMLTFGANATQDIVIVGHSLGAAIACVLAARLRLGNPTRRIQLLVMGCPRPGDIRLKRLLDTCEVVSLGNDGDVVLAVPSNFYDIPPDLRFLTNLAYPAGAPFWEFPPNQQRIGWTGQVQQGAADPGLQEALNKLWLWFVGQGPFPDLSPHLQDEYQRRLCGPAPEPILWLDAWDFDRAEGDPVPLWPNRVDPTNSPAITPVTGTPFFVGEGQGMLRAVEFAGNDLLQLPLAVGGTPAWSWYAVCEIAFPAFSYPSSARFGVPIGTEHVVGIPDADWRGPALSSPGWSVSYGTATARVPWDGGVVAPALLAAYWDGSQLRIRLENALVAENVFAGHGAPASWHYVGGIGAPPQPTPTATLLLGEVLFYDDLLSSAQDASILAYLRVKWLTHAVGLATESDDLLTTESGDVLVTE